VSEGECWLGMGCNPRHWRGLALVFITRIVHLPISYCRTSQTRRLGALFELTLRYHLRFSCKAWTDVIYHCYTLMLLSLAILFSVLHSVYYNTRLDGGMICFIFAILRFNGHFSAFAIVAGHEQLNRQL